MSRHIGFNRARWLGLALLGIVGASTAYGGGCDPVIEGGYGVKIVYAAVYSSCTTTDNATEQTVSINYHPNGYIYTVTAPPDQYSPPASASTASIGSLVQDAYESQDMGVSYAGNCLDMKGKTGVNPPASAGHYYCFRFYGADADLYLGGFLTATNVFESGTASIVFPPTTDDFITTWKTDNPGTSSDTSITVPMIGGPYDVDWNNDGTFDDLGLSGSKTHDYGVVGTYTIRIRGTYDSIQFNGGGDKEKILSLDQWGTNIWITMRSAFKGAANLTVPAADTPDFSAVTSMRSMFQGATMANPDTSGWNTAAVTSFVSMFNSATMASPDTSGWNTAAVTGMAYMFYDAALANPDVSGWNTAAVANMSLMFSGASSFDQDLGFWDVTALTVASRMFAGITLSTANYESLLIGWDAQVLHSGVEFSGGNSSYCSESAIAARANMITSDLWVITDAGQGCATDTFTVGGTVSGLEGSGLVLQNKATDDLAISGNGGFTFATALDNGIAYVVTVLTQPTNPDEICNVSNGSGNLDGADIVDILVTCVANSENIFTDGFEE